MMIITTMKIIIYTKRHHKILFITVSHFFSRFIFMIVIVYPESSTTRPNLFDMIVGPFFSLFYIYVMCSIFYGIDKRQ